MEYLVCSIIGVYVAIINYKSKVQNNKTKIALIMSGFLIAEGLILFLVLNVL
jgi:hypothetical protein